MPPRSHGSRGSALARALFVISSLSASATFSACGSDANEAVDSGARDAGADAAAPLGDIGADDPAAESLVPADGGSIDTDAGGTAPDEGPTTPPTTTPDRSEERRVGKECRSRW